MKAIKVRHAHVGRILPEWQKEIMSYDDSIIQGNVIMVLDILVKVGYLTVDTLYIDYSVNWDYIDPIQPEDIISAYQSGLGMDIYIRKRKIMKIRARVIENTVKSIKTNKGILSWF